MIYIIYICIIYIYIIYTYHIYTHTSFLLPLVAVKRYVHASASQRNVRKPFKNWRPMDWATALAAGKKPPRSDVTPVRQRPIGTWMSQEVSKRLGSVGYNLYLLNWIYWG